MGDPVCGVRFDSACAGVVQGVVNDQDRIMMAQSSQNHVTTSAMCHRTYLLGDSPYRKNVGHGSNLHQTAVFVQHMDHGRGSDILVQKRQNNRTQCITEGALRRQGSPARSHTVSPWAPALVHTFDVSQGPCLFSS
jgi:hypothetical protein